MEVSQYYFCSELTNDRIQISVRIDHHAHGIYLYLVMNADLHGFTITYYTVSDEIYTLYPKKYAHGFCFAVLCCGYTLTDFPISIRLTSLALWQSNDCPSASKATLVNMDKYLMWIHNEWLHNHNKAKHNKTVCIFLGIFCTLLLFFSLIWRMMQTDLIY